jgi:hypothetical protein
VASLFGGLFVVPKGRDGPEEVCLLSGLSRGSRRASLEVKACVIDSKARGWVWNASLVGRWCRLAANF